MRKRILTAAFVLGLYGILYVLNYYFFDLYKPCHLYTVSWTTRNVLPFVLVVTILMTLLGKWYLASFFSVAGYLSGIVLDELLGGIRSNIPPRYLHYGWLIWGCVYIGFLIIGIITERVLKRKNPDWNRLRL